MALLRLDFIGRLGRSVREIGPCAALALLLPGGTLIAGLIWMARHRSWLVSHARALAARLLIGARSGMRRTADGRRAL
jgi:hypothetical protein